MGDQDSQRQSFGNFDASIFQDVSRSVDQFCNQMSYANINVPKLSSFSDVFEFISEYETITAAMSDEQRVKLLVKAFPPGKNRAWFETELKPMILTNKGWRDIKTKIVKRFSDTEDKDRHLIRIREMKYEPNNGQRLLDFVEDILYSFKKAFPEENNEETCTRFVKAAIPTSVMSTGLIPSFKEVKTIEELMRVAKLYDSSKGSSNHNKLDKGIQANELASILRELVKGIKEEGTNTRNAINSAIMSVMKPPGNYPQGHMNENRYSRNSYSPRRREYQSPNRINGRQSPNNYRDNRPVSPRNYNNYNNNYNNQPNKDQEPANSNINNNNWNGLEAYNNKIYFERFGKPPKPCSECNTWHWVRHCPLNLN